MLRTLKNLTFVYVPREDRVLAAINAGQQEAWSCWLTRRLALAVLERATAYVARTSDMAQRAPADLRGEFVAFGLRGGRFGDTLAPAAAPTLTVFRRVGLI